MSKLLFILLLIFSFSFVTYAQDWNEIYYLEGEAQYLIEEKEYVKAIDLYRKMIKEIPDNTYAKYMIGKLYLKSDDEKLTSIDYLEEASQNIALDFNDKSLREIRTPVDVLLYLGQAYQHARRIDEAIVVYNNFKDLIGEEDENYKVVLNRLKSCNQAKEALKNPLRVYAKNLGEPLNNEKSNFNAVVSGDGNTIIYTSYTRNYLDNYYTTKQNEIWSTPKRISEKISTKYYLKTSCLSHDGNELYMVTDDPEKNDIFVSYKDGKSWSEAEKLDKTISGKKSNETHACISKDGNTLFFTSDRKDGFGGLDIYKSTKDSKGRWSEPVNMGSNINTPFDEETPFVTMDDKYLFFSSKGHNSIGGFDIFYVDLSSNSSPENLGYPANTPGDDLFFVPDNSLTSGWISRFDSTSLGRNDIYYLSILPNINFAGTLKNSDDGSVINDPGVSISFIDSATNEIVETITPENGKFNFEISPGNYHAIVNNSKYETYTEKINIPVDYTEKDFLFEAQLSPIQVETEEMLAELPEEQTVEPENTEIIEKNKEETVPEISEEKKEEEPVKQEKEEVTEEVPEKEEIIPTKEDPVEVKEKEFAIYTPKPSNTPREKTYSVQLMALKNPVEVDYFKNVDNVILTKHPDGFYRYTVGITNSYDEAEKLKEQIHQIGYKDAFIRINNFAPSYTIQIMALIIPVKPEHFKDLSSVVITKGSDDYFRYTIGNFSSYDEAKEELQKLNSMGYNQAFIKKVSGNTSLAVHD